MEKRGVIESGRTPPEKPECSEESRLEEHLSKRAAEQAAEQLKEATDGDHTE